MKVSLRFGGGSVQLSHPEAFVFGSSGHRRGVDGHLAGTADGGDTIPGRASSGGDGRVGVAIVTRNRRDRLLATLERLVRLPEQPTVVVLDNGSTDDTVDAVMGAFPEVTVLGSDVDLGTAARNLVAEWLETPYVAFCADDAAWAPGSLAHATDLFDTHDDLALVCAPDGCARPPAGSAGTRRATPRALGPAVLRFSADAAVVRTSAFTEVGGFDERLPSGIREELLAIDLLAAGWRTAQVAALAVHGGGADDTAPVDPSADDIRNELWATWLRRSSPAAIRRTGTVLRSLPLERRSARGVASAVGGLPWVLRSRRPVPPALERELRRREREAPPVLTPAPGR